MVEEKREREAGGFLDGGKHDERSSFRRFFQDLGVSKTLVDV